jgi:hypothetical protein
MENSSRPNESERVVRLTPGAVAATPGSARAAKAKVISSARRDAWAHVWFTATPDRWSSLAVVPAAPGLDAASTAEALVQAGQSYGMADVLLINAIGARPETIGDVVDACTRRTAAGQKTVVALDSPFTNPAAIAIARTVDVVLLAVLLGGVRIAQARGTIDVIGRERFVGAVTIGADGRPRAEG